MSKLEIKADSRFMLPLEMLLCCQALVWAVYGGLPGPNAAYNYLNSLNQSPIWFYTVGITGVVGLFCCLSQFLFGRCWGVFTINAVVGCRSVSNFVLGLCWVYLTRAALDYQPKSVVVFVGVLGAIFSAWAFFENVKVRHAINNDCRIVFVR